MKKSRPYRSSSGFVEDGRESAGQVLVRNRQRRRDWKHEQITRAEKFRQKHDLKMV